MEIHRPRTQFGDAFVKMFPEFRAKNAAAVKTITFVVTEDCTLRCSYCYQCNKDFGSNMTKKTAMKAVDTILSDEKMNGYIDSSVTKGVILDFIGGEPLLAVELIGFICDYFRYKAYKLGHPWAKNHMFSISTNGTEYFRPEVQNFIQKNAARLSLGITIDGHKDLHDACRLYPDGSGSYDRVEKAVKYARENFGHTSTKVTLAPENLQFINTAIPHLIDNLGLTDVNANPVFEDVWEDYHAQEFYEELVKLADWFIDGKKYKYAACSLFDRNIGTPLPESDTGNWCGGSGAMLAIGTDGSLYPCIRFMKYSLSNKERPEFLIGSAEKGVDDTTGPRCNKFIKELWGITRQSQSSQECLNCPVGRGCAWCTGYNYDVFGTPNKRAVFICKLHKARCLANYYYWNKLYSLEGVNESFPLNLSEEDILFLTCGKGIAAEGGR